MLLQLFAHFPLEIIESTLAAAVAKGDSKLEVMGTDGEEGFSTGFPIEPTTIGKLEEKKLVTIQNYSLFSFFVV